MSTLVGLVANLCYQSIAVVDQDQADGFRKAYPLSATPDVAEQIRNVNDFFRCRLGVVSTPASIEARSALEECELEAWCRQFVRYVVPAIVQMRIF